MKPHIVKRNGIWLAFYDRQVEHMPPPYNRPLARLADRSDLFAMLAKYHNPSPRELQVWVTPRTR